MAKDYNADLLIQQKGNLGYSADGVVLEKMVGMILMPKSFRLTAANLSDDATLVGVLQVASTAVPSGRVIPFFGPDAFVDFTDNTAEAAMEESGYGNLMGVTFKKPIFTIRTGNLGQYLNQQLWKFNGNKSLSVALVDAKGRMYLERTGTSAKGFECSLMVDQTKLATGTTAMAQNFKLQLTREDALMNPDTFMVYPFSQSFLSLNRLSDVLMGIHNYELTLITATTTAITVSAIRKEDLKNMADADAYATQMAAAGAWVLTLASTGAAVTVTGVTVNALKQFVLAGTFTTALHSLSGATSAALKVLTIGTASTGGYESNVIAVTPA